MSIEKKEKEVQFKGLSCFRFTKPSKIYISQYFTANCLSINCHYQHHFWGLAAAETAKPHRSKNHLFSLLSHLMWFSCTLGSVTRNNTFWNSRKYYLIVFQEIHIRWKQRHLSILSNAQHARQIGGATVVSTIQLKNMMCSFPFASAYISLYFENKIK